MTARRPPDVLALERMVLGTGEDAGAWDDLLASPQAAQVWQTAVERRHRIDAFAAVLSAHPWLAAPTLSLRRGMRRLAKGTWPGATLDLSSALSATLSADAPRSVTLALAETRVLELAPGTSLRITLPVGTRLRRLTDSGERPFDAPGWEMETGDGLVVLLAVRDDGPPLAALMLVESPSRENGE